MLAYTKQYIFTLCVARGKGFLQTIFDISTSKNFIEQNCLASRSLSSQQRVSTVFRLQSSVVDNCYPCVRISVNLLLGIAVTFDARGTIVCAIIVYAIVAAIAELTAKATGRFDGRGALPAVVDQCHVPALRYGFSHYMLSFAKLLASPSNLDEYETMLS